VAGIVERRLAGPLGVVQTLRSERQAIEHETVAGRAVRDQACERAKAVVGECYDVVWNRVGRPRIDTQLDLVFPGGIGAVVDGPADSLALRIGAVRDLLGRGLHPRIPADVVTTWSARLADEAAAVATAAEVVARTSARAHLAERAFFAVTRGVHGALTATKRDLKSAGLTEAAIHEIIPSRPGPRAADPAPGPVQS